MCNRHMGQVGAFLLHSNKLYNVQVGGTPAVLKLLLENGLVDGSCMTVTGKLFWPLIGHVMSQVGQLSLPFSD